MILTENPKKKFHQIKKSYQIKVVEEYFWTIKENK
jgi:hypothetical protein